MPSAFLWNGNTGEITTPQAAERQRKIAAALLPQGRVATNPWEGLSQITGALTGSILNSRANEADQAGQQQADQLVAGLQGGADQSQLIAALSNPYVANDPGKSAVVQALFQQSQQNSDPLRQLQIKAAEKALATQPKQWQKLDNNTLFDATTGETKPIDGARGSDFADFQGTGLDAQAWNVLQNSDPSSKAYATAYSIVSQPKQQMVQTENGMMLVNTPPSLPAWLVPPSGAVPAQTPVTPPVTAPAAAAPVPNQSQANPAIFNPGQSQTQLPLIPPAAPAAEAAAASSPGNIIPGTKKPPTEQQQRNELLATVLTSDLPTINANFDALADPKGQILDKVPGGLLNAWQSEEYQRAANAVSSSVSSILYSVSGASSNPGEVATQVRNLTPQFGDKPGTIADKKRRLNTFIEAVSKASGDPDLIAKARRESMAGLGTDKPVNQSTPASGAIVDWNDL